jgi:hypothetical protein
VRLCRTQATGYGTIFPDFTRRDKNPPLVSPAFTALGEGHGIGGQGRKLDVKPEGGKKRVAIADDYLTSLDVTARKPAK